MSHPQSPHTISLLRHWKKWQCFLLDHKIIIITPSDWQWSRRQWLSLNFHLFLITSPSSYLNSQIVFSGFPELSRGHRTHLNNFKPFDDRSSITFSRSGAWWILMRTQFSSKQLMMLQLYYPTFPFRDWKFLPKEKQGHKTQQTN